MLLRIAKGCTVYGSVTKRTVYGGVTKRTPVHPVQAIMAYRLCLAGGQLCRS